MVSTTPGTSSESSAPRTARRLPTASIFGCHSLVTALVAETVWGVLAMPAIASLILPLTKVLKPNNPPSTAPTRMSMMSIRLIIVCLLH